VGCVLGDPYLDGVWLASVDGHAHSEAAEDCGIGAVGRGLLRALGVVQKLGGPGQQQQAVLHIQGPGNGVYWVMESHGEGITLCCNLHHTQDWYYALGAILHMPGTVTGQQAISSSGQHWAMVGTGW